jgi:CDP-glucose 4,6-dehydratase
MTPALDSDPAHGGDTAFWRGRPTLVTGATGLVGSWTVRRLLDLGADVVCLVRDWVPQSELVRSGLLERVRVVRGDIRSQQQIERALGEFEITTVLHLAAQTIVGIANRNPVSTFESNIQGTWAVLEACRRSPLVGQVVVASSDKAYGESDRLPYVESTPLRGQHPYDVSKACADLIARSYFVTWGLPVAITRCGNFYGGGDLNWTRVVPGTIRSILRGERPVIRSDGDYVRDYFYVEDGAAVYTLLAEKLAANGGLAGEAFNFSYGSRTTVRQIVERILSRMESPLQPDIRRAAAHEIRSQCLDAAKAREMLGWSPRFTLDDGLDRTIAWYRDFLAA